MSRPVRTLSEFLNDETIGVIESINMRRKVEDIGREFFALNEGNKDFQIMCYVVGGKRHDIRFMVDDGGRYDPDKKVRTHFFLLKTNSVGFEMHLFIPLGKRPPTAPYISFSTNSNNMGIRAADCRNLSAETLIGHIRDSLRTRLELMGLPYADQSG